MEVSEDSASDVSETVLAPFDKDELPHLPDEVVEDQTKTKEVDDFLSDDDSPASLILDDGTPAIKPRPYQLEMVQESMSKNIIVAMDTGSGKTHWYSVLLVQVQSSILLLSRS
jgi:superfamily II DNA or RNA helicase